MPPRRTISIVGAGIIGAMIAHVLARAGHKVHLVDQHTEPGMGVSAASFGWVHGLMIDPDNPGANQGTRNDAIARYRALDDLLRGQLLSPARGAILWSTTAAQTAAMARKLAKTTGAGAVQRLGPAAITALVPRLSLPPPLALFAPDDLALNAGAAARLLAKDAAQHGAHMHMGRRALRIAHNGDQITTLHLDDGDTLPCDAVILAAGLQSAALMAPFATLPPVLASPSTLVTLQARHAPLACVLAMPEFELRSDGTDRLLVAVDSPEPDTGANRAALGARVADSTRRLIGGLDGLRVTSVQTIHRPMPIGGGPLLTQAAALPGLICAVAHPGVVLAPAMAEAACALIEDRPATAIAPRQLT